MKTTLETIILPQIDELIAKYETMRNRAKYDDLSDLPDGDIAEFVTAGIAAISRATGNNSQYTLAVTKNLETVHWTKYAFKIPHVIGSLRAVRSAIVSGYLNSVQELIHADLFSDFLEMAEYLLNEGFKDPSAVIIGSVLEEHLRKLCLKNSIAIEIIDARGTRPKKAEAMNTDLAGASVYTKLDQKNVTAWLDLRNKAAHGRYTEYTQSQVELLLQSVRDFLTRHAA